MNLFGVGNLEIIVILLVALLVLGPGRMVDAARSLGQFWNDAQRTLRAAADAATVRLDEPLTLSSSRDPVPEPEGAVAREQAEDPESRGQ
jgi:Sec-independent protein translocase protein TatA